MKQLENAHAKLTLTQQRAADKKAANARILERLQGEYNDMAEQRQENDLQLAEIRKEAAEVEEKVHCTMFHHSSLRLTRSITDI